MFNFKGKLTTEDVQVWMDGGTVTLVLHDPSSQTCEIEFVQKVVLKKHKNFPRPGSLLINSKEVEVRSDLEKEILLAVQHAEWGKGIREEEKDSLKKVIDDCIKFVESERYIELAQFLK